MRDHVKPNEKLITQMNVASVNTLEGDHPQYRLGDAVLCRHAPYGKNAFNLVANNRNLFKGTVLFEYASRIDRSNSAPQLEVLKEVISEKSSEIKLQFPMKDELVIHLRLGDQKGFKLDAEKLVNYVMGLLDRFESPVSKITIATAIHFGQSVIQNQTSEDQISLSTSNDIAKLEKIIDLLSGNGQAVRLYSHEDIDRDFCFLSNSKRMVLGNGNFSLCAAMISSAVCFMPPWVKNGAGLDVHKLLESKIAPYDY